MSEIDRFLLGKFHYQLPTNWFSSHQGSDFAQNGLYGNFEWRKFKTPQCPKLCEINLIEEFLGLGQNPLPLP